MTGRDVSQFFVRPSDSIGQVIAAIDRSGPVSLALVVDERGRLINTLSDGDVRRGLLAGFKLQDEAAKLFEIKARTPRPFAVTAPAHTDAAELQLVLERNGVRQVPLLASDGVVVDIVTARDLRQTAAPFRAVVMAGGQGS